MQNACRSCLLRLGQPWRTPTRHRPSPRLLPHNTLRPNHGMPSYVEGTSQENHERQDQRETGPALTTHSATLSVNEHNTAHWPRPGAEESPAFADTPPLPPDRHVSIEKVPKPRPRYTPSVSTFTPRDKRVEFIKEFDQLEDQSWALAKVLRRFGEWELFQRERLEKHPKGTDRQRAFATFGAWKSVVKEALSHSSKGATPISVMEKRQLRFIRSCHTLEEMMASMPRFPENISMQIRWDSDRMLLSIALRYAPDKVHLVLESALRTHKKRFMTHFYVVEDVLELLATRLRVMEAGERQAFAEKLADLVVCALRNSLSNHIQISQATIYPILDALPAAAVDPWYHQLQAVNCNLHPFTELQFASRLAKSSPTKGLSAKIVHNLTTAGLVDINSPAAASVCTSILTFRKEDLATLDDQSVTPADLFRHLHDIGLIPNVITYSAIIRGLCLKKDLRTALDVLEVMKQHGVQPDAFTYSILINGCKLCGDFATLAELAIQACNANTRDPVVWNDVLHGVYICCLRERKRKRGPRRTALYTMNEIYSRIFDVEPVKPFITGRLVEMGELIVQQQWVPDSLKPMISEIPPLPPLEVLRPGSDTLAIMIVGLIRCLPMPYDVAVFYSQFRQMLTQGHPVAELLVRERGTFVHDIVLRNLIKWRGTLRVALDIIRDMMSDVGKDADPTVTPSAPSPTAELGPRGQMPPRTANPGAPAANVEAAATVGRLAPDNTRTGWPVDIGEGPVADIDTAPEDVEASSSSTETAGPEARAPGPQPPHANEVLTPPGSPIRHPAPSVYTWTILMHGFMRHKLPREAELILKLMREHGVEPNSVTWNTLAAGYAKMQKIPKTVESMRRLETEGFKADDWTLRAFSYLSNKQRAIKLMEATVEANKLKKMASESREQEAGVGQTAGQQWEAEQAPAQEQQQDGGDPGQWRQDEEDDALDQELEARLSQLDPGAVPGTLSKKIHREIHIQKMEKIARISKRSELSEWARVRELGLDAVSVPKTLDNGTGGRDLSRGPDSTAG